MKRVDIGKRFTRKKTWEPMVYSGGFQPMGHGPVVGHDAVFSGPQSFFTINSKLRVATFLSLSW